MSFSNLYFSYQGQIKRKPFIWAYLSLFIPGILYACAGAYFEYLIESQKIVDPKNVLAGELFMLGVAVVVAILLFYISICLIIKRLRDTQRSPWLALLWLVPVINLILLIYLMFCPTSSAETRKHVQY